MKGSLTLGGMKKLDKSDMLGLLLDFPLQCKTAQDLAGGVKISFAERKFSRIVFAGLGGSAIGADLVRAYLYFESALPISVIREYDLPAYVDNSTLIFIASYSGNTEETLSAYAQAKKKGCCIIAMSSGGKLRESALADNITFVQIPEGLPPRCALGYMSIIPLCILAKLGIIQEVSAVIAEAVKTLEDLKNSVIHPRINAKDNAANPTGVGLPIPYKEGPKYVASKLLNKLAIIYSASVHFDVVATRLRGQLSENSKCLASSHVFPEMNHNEIVGWQNPKKLFKNLIVVMIRDAYMHPRVAKRMDITKDILKKEGVEVLEIWSRGDGLLSRIFSLIYIGDFVSYYLAILYGIDPTPVEKVIYLKKKLAEEK